MSTQDEKCEVCGKTAVVGTYYCETHGSRSGAKQWKKTVAEKHGEAAAGMAESSVLADEQRREWAKHQADNPKTYQERLDEAGAVDLRDNLRLEHLGNGYVRAEPIDPTKRHGQSRGVEGELKPLPKAHRQCGSRFCRKSALTGSAFCEDHSDESQPLKSNGRKS